MFLALALLLFWQDALDDRYRDYPVIQQKKHISKTALTEFPKVTPKLDVRSLGLGQVGSISRYEVTILRIVDNHTLKVNLYLNYDLEQSMTVVVKNLPSLKSIVDDDQIILEDLFRVDEVIESRNGKLFVLSSLTVEDSLKAYKLAFEKVKLMEKQARDAEANSIESIAKQMAEERNWQLKNGKSIAGVFVATKNDSVVFQVSKTKKLTVKIAVLEPDDQELVRKFEKAAIEIKQVSSRR